LIREDLQFCQVWQSLGELPGFADRGDRVEFAVQE